MRLNIVKRTVMATALAVATAVAGVAGQAQAFSFGQNDLVLAIYGNNTEALINLGNYNTLLANNASTSLNLATALGDASVGTLANVRYTIFGWDLCLPNGQIHAGTAFAPSALTGTKDFNTQFINSIGYSNLSFVGDTISKTDPSGRSFFQNLNTSGTGSLT